MVDCLDFINKKPTPINICLFFNNIPYYKHYKELQLITLLCTYYISECHQSHQLKHQMPKMFSKMLPYYHKLFYDPKGQSFDDLNL